MGRSSKIPEAFLEKGKEAEVAFGELFRDTSLPTEEQDMREHWDIKLSFKVDVKELKRINRSDANVNQNFHYLEIKNVNGRNGWVYGEADYFAFELVKYWVIVEKGMLQQWIALNVQKEYVDKPEPYKLYSRAERKDVMTLIPSVDLCYLANKMIKKTLKGKGVTL
jgi:hypothetical protein